MASDPKVLEVRIGVIQQADPVSNVYWIKPNKGRVFRDGRTVEVPVQATVLNTSTTNLDMVIHRTAYPVGTSVLYVENADESMGVGIEKATILGAIASDIGSTYKSQLKHCTIPGGLDGFNTQFPDIHRTQYQNIGQLRDFAGNGASDVWFGDYVVSGKNTLSLIGNDRIWLSAGACLLSMDTITRRLILDSLLRTITTISSIEDVSIVNQQTVHTIKHAGNVMDAYGSCQIDEGAEQKYRYVHQVSDITGESTDAVLTTYGTALAKMTQRFDGALSLQSATSIHLERTPLIPYYDYKGKRLAKDEKARNLDLFALIEENKDIASYLDFTENWGSACIDAELTAYSDINEDDGEAVDVDVYKLGNSVYPNKGEHTIALNNATIDITPTGGIVLKDAWGSELRMMNGNIQLSAANTLTTVSGRDTMMLQGGALGINATKGVDLAGVEGAVLIKGTDVKMAAGSEEAKGNIVLESGNGEVLITATTGALVTAPSIDIISTDIGNETSAGNVNIISRGGNVAIGSKTATVVSSEQAIQIASPQSHLDLSSSITLNSVGTTCIGGIVYMYPLRTYSNVISTQNGDGQIRPIASSSSMLELNGQLRAMGSIMANGDICTSSSVFCTSVCAKDVQEIQGVYKLRTKPVRIPTSFRQPTSIAKLIKVSYKYLAELKNKKIYKKLFRFNKEGSCLIYDTPMSSTNTATTPIAVATHVDNTGKTSYIYPGESFWKENGMRTISVHEDRTIPDSSKFEYKGASSLKVLMSTVKEKE